MTAINPFKVIPFGSTGGGTGQFGSGTGTNGNYGGTISTDPVVIQGLASWLQGYANLTNTDANGLPYAEDHTGIWYVITQALAYIQQSGIGEYLSTVNYRMGAIVTSIGTSQAYISKKVDNLGNALTDTASWASIGDLANLKTVALTGAYSDLSGKPTLGTSSTLDVGITANKVVQLDANAKLPAVDGSQLTNIISTSPPSSPYSIIQATKNANGNTNFITKIDNNTTGFDLTTPLKLCYPDGSTETCSSSADIIGVTNMTGNANYTVLKEKGVTQALGNAYDGTVLRLTEGKLAPASAVNGDYYLDTSVIPNIPYKRVAGAWVMTQFVKLGYFTKAGGVIGTITSSPIGDENNKGTTYNYNNGLTLSYNTVYQAPSNGFISVILSGSFRNGMQLVYGTTNNPTDVQAQFGDDINSNSKLASICVPIQRGTYWKVQPALSDGWETIIVRFYPMGF
jgi:hypothetical protein